jgi:hypothetical protein
MITTTQEIIEKFGQLPMSEKKIVVSVILRDALETETSALSDDELVLSAEDIFLELDRKEASDGKS